MVVEGIHLEKKVQQEQTQLEHDVLLLADLNEIYQDVYDNLFYLPSDNRDQNYILDFVLIFYENTYLMEIFLLVSIVLSIF
jgi:hypothetical protein